MNMYKVIQFVCKISDAFPIGGGAIGAASQAKNLTEFMPTWESVVAAVIVSIIGASVGYLIKLLFDIIFKTVRDKYNCK